MKKFALPNLPALALALAMVAWTGQPVAADAPLVNITGTVVSMDDGVLVLATDRGNLTFDLDKSTEMPSNIVVGNRITVSYDSDDKVEDKMDARKIVMAPISSSVSPTTPAPTAQVTTQESGTAYQDEQTELPATASPLPLMAGAGLLALVGSFLLRKRTRR